MLNLVAGLVAGSTMEIVSQYKLKGERAHLLGNKITGRSRLMMISTYTLRIIVGSLII